MILEERKWTDTELQQLKEAVKASQEKNQQEQKQVIAEHIKKGNKEKSND